MAKPSSLRMNADDESQPDLFSYARTQQKLNSEAVNTVDIVQNEASVAPQLIVQCPACQTKFALDSQVIEGLSEPRFHCSRCDHIFSIEGEPQLISAAPSLTSSVPTLTSAAPTLQNATPQVSSTSLANLEHSALLSPEEAFDPPSWQEEFDSAPPPPPRYRALEIPEPLDVPSLPSAPHEKANDRKEVEISQSQLNLNISEPTPAKDSHGVAFDTWDSGPIASSDLMPELTNPAHMSMSTATEIINKYAPPELEAKPLEESFTSGAFTFPKPAAYAPVYRPPREFGLWQSLLIIASPMVMFLALLIGISIYLRQNRETAVTLASTLLPSAPQPAPSGLYLKNTRYRRIALDSGESVQLISGRVYNDTPDDFTQVTVEAVAFDHQGNSIIRTKVLDAGKLAKARIRSMTPEMIHEVQFAKDSKGFRLRAGEEEEFAVVLAGTEDLLPSPKDLDRAESFTARIYSVRQ